MITNTELIEVKEPRAGRGKVARGVRPGVTRMASRGVEVSGAGRDYTELVSTVVSVMQTRVPSYVSRDEMISVGNLGLVKAIENYDSGKGSAFETYASIRIRGAIMDWMRKADNMSRSDRQSFRRMQDFIEAYELANGRAPGEDEVREALGLTWKEFRNLKLSAEGCVAVSLDSPSGEGGATMGSMIEDDSQEDARDLLQRKEMKELLFYRMKRLPDRERKIMALYYHEEISFAKIAEAMGISESRVCQLHQKALAQLRRFIESETLCSPLGN